MKALKKVCIILLVVCMSLACFSGCDLLSFLPFGSSESSSSSKSEYLTAQEFKSQVAYYGDNENETTKSSMRIGFSIKMKAKTSIIFLGDESVYKFKVCEMADVASKTDYVYDSGWLESGMYITKQECYPVIMLARKDGATISNEELLSIHSFFDVNGVKLAPAEYGKEGALTGTEYEAQVVHYGSVPNPVLNTRARISFSIKMQKGATVEFVGDKSIYKWAVCELYNTSHISGYLDSNWNIAWTNPNVNYTMHADGAYLVLTLARKDEKALTDSEFANMRSMFEVTGEKWTKHRELEPSQGTVKAVNHRGYCLKAPENTLAAYRESALHGFKIVECDVLFTSDQKPVLLHDDTIDRTSDGSGKISDMTLEQVREYDFGSWRDLEYAGEKIPTFEEFMSLCVELNLHPYIEVKGNISVAQAQKLVDIVKSYNKIDDVSWISFGYNSLKNIVSINDKARVGFLPTGSGVTQNAITQAKSLMTGKNEVFLDCNYLLVNDAGVELCRQQGMPLEIYTLNNPADISKISSYITGVTSDWLVIGDYFNK